MTISPFLTYSDRARMDVARRPKASVPVPAPSDVHVSGRKAAVGDRFGDLTVEEDIGRDEYGSVYWRCRCACGNRVARSTTRLNWAVRHGLSPRCNACGAERQRARNRVVTAEAFRQQYAGTKSLWSGGQTAHLMAEVRADLEAEFGEVPDHFDFPPTVENGFPWCASEWSACMAQGRISDE